MIELKDSMKTTSVMIQNLCVPCFNRCRYCLLSWDGKIEGINWEKSIVIAKRFIDEINTHLPHLKTSFSFGYSMEHPHFEAALNTLHQLKSPMTDFLQCNGMKMRNDNQCDELMLMFKKEGIKELNFTFYGLAEYHDSFAGRKGDFDLLFRMMKAAKKYNLPFTASIPLTKENIKQINALVEILEKEGSKKTRLFIPHEEGRGKSLKDVRLTKDDLSLLSSEAIKLFNHSVYKTESEWLSETDPIKQQNRLIIISLRADNIKNYENKNAISIIKEIEALDEEYYASFPDFTTLAKKYGDYQGNKLYRIRDLYHHYRLCYCQEYQLKIYDVTDERKSGSRRY